MGRETFDVVYEHLGDRMYYAGETREAEAADVEHLIPGTLRRRDETEALPEQIDADADNGTSTEPENAADETAAAKADDTALNKAEGKSTKTKGAE